eukprot:403346311
MLCVLLFFSFKLKVLLNCEDNKTSRLIINEAQIDNPEIINAYGLGFDIAVGSASGDFDPRYGSYRVIHTDKSRISHLSDGQVSENYKVTELKLIKCEDKYFNYPRKNETAYQDVYGFLCIEDKSYLQVGGSWSKNKLQRIGIELVQCHNTTSNKNHCATQEQINKYFSLRDVQIRYVNQYFDYDDMIDDVKKFVEDRYFIPIEPQIQKGVLLNIRKISTQQHDSYIPFQQQVSKTFVSITDVQFYSASLEMYGEKMVNIELRADFVSEKLTRQVYNFSDLLSDLGGIYSALFAIGAILVAQFSQNMFYGKMIKNLYQVRLSRNQQKDENEDQINTKNQNQIFDNSTINQSYLKHGNNQSFDAQVNNQFGSRFALISTSQNNVTQDDSRQMNKLSRPNAIKPNPLYLKAPILSPQLPPYKNNRDRIDTGNMKRIVSLGPIIEDCGYNSKENYCENRDKFVAQGTQKHQKNSYLPYQALQSKANSIREYDSKINQTQTINNELITKNNSIFMKIVEEIQNRVMFQFGVFDMIRMKLSCRKFCANKKQSRDEDIENKAQNTVDSTDRKIRLFKKGVKRINQEFDAMSLMKLMNQFKLLTKVLLNPTQKMLLGFQKKNILNSESSDNEENPFSGRSSDSEEFEDESKIIKKLKAQNQLLRLVSLGKIKRKINDYFNEDRKFKEIDEKLLNGILTRKIQRNKFIQKDTLNSFKHQYSMVEETVQNEDSSCTFDQQQQITIRNINTQINGPDSQLSVKVTSPQSKKQKHQNRLQKLNLILNMNQMDNYSNSFQQQSSRFSNKIGGGDSDDIEQLFNQLSSTPFNQQKSDIANPQYNQQDLSKIIENSDFSKFESNFQAQESPNDEEMHDQIMMKYGNYYNQQQQSNNQNQQKKY